MLQRIPVAQIQPYMSEGTWAQAAISGVPVYQRSAGAAAATIASFNLGSFLPNVDKELMGAGLQNAYVTFRVATADQDTVTAITVYTIEYDTGAPVDTAVDTSLYTVTGYLNGSTTAAAANAIGIAQGDWMIKIAFDPVFQIADTQQLMINVDNDPAGGTVLSYWDLILEA